MHDDPQPILARRTFLGELGLGFGGMVLGTMLQQDGVARADTDTSLRQVATPHFRPRVKNVIWLFMIGGTSHLESFDPKPALNRYAGKTIDETPFRDSVLNSPYLKKNFRDVFNRKQKVYQTIFPMQVGFRKHGQSGIEVSNWWPHVSESIDDIAVVRSLWTTDNDHGAQLQFHTGRHKLDGVFPSIGSWVHYGLGSLNHNLPQFVVLGQGVAECCGGRKAHGADYLGPAHAGVQLEAGSKVALPFASPGDSVYVEEQRAMIQLLGKLNRLTQREFPRDEKLEARIKSYELAFRMQTAVPKLFELQQETRETQRLYGLNRPATTGFARRCLAARRLVEQGVRFVQVFHGGNGGAGRWDSHKNLKAQHRNMCQQVDRPIGALLKDLKRRGLLDDTLVVWATEFGRSSGAQNAKGRDHHPYGFSVWLAGGGIKGGTVHGATDELGFHAVQDRHYVTDLHATVLKQLGLDSRRLAFPGRKRLDIDFGKPIEAVVA